MLDGGPFLLLSTVCCFIFAWFVLDCGLCFLLLRVFLCFFCCRERCCVVGFRELSEKVGGQKPPKKYSSRKLLHRRMLDLHLAYKSFVSGAKNGQATYFHCRVCCRYVAMRAQGAGEFKRRFESDKHWVKDVTYRVHMGCQRHSWLSIGLNPSRILVKCTRSLRILLRSTFGWSLKFHS